MIFSILFFFSLFTLSKCAQSQSVSIQPCLNSTLAPFLLIIIFIFFKVLCFREQRIILWTFFIVCLLSQMFVLKHVIGHFTNQPVPLPGLIQNIHLTQWLMFTPAMVFCLAIDVQFYF
jgi:hypothetical protein